MDSRFTFKDFVFLMVFVVLIGAVAWMSYQFNYQEGRLNDVKAQLVRINDDQKQQVGVLVEIRNALKNGVTVNGGVGAGTQASSGDGRIRRKNPDGSLYVYYPHPPKSPREPERNADYATGDWLVQNLDGEPKLIAPFIQKDYYGQLVQVPVLESLVGQNAETFEYEPMLAESYEISADGLTFRFVMRKEATFSDGLPVTVDDVVFSYDTVMNQDVDCAPLRGYYEHVKSCRKVDERTVEFKMDEPYFRALDFIGGLSILPAHVYQFAKGEDYNRRGDLLVGSGPYMMDKWERGQQIEMVRNEKYWADRGSFDRLVFKFITNPQAAFQAFENGQVDVTRPDPEQWVKFSTDPDFLKKFIAHKFTRPNSGYGYIGYNEEHAMFKDKETRQALTMLIDRKAVIHTILKDMAVEITSPFSPVTPQNDATIKPWPYDPEGAKKKLAAAGWKVGEDGVLVRDGVRFEFDLSMGTGNPTGERIANYVKEQLERAGIRMRIMPWEFAVLVGRLDDRNFDAVMMGWSGEIEEDPYQTWHSESIKDKGSNFISFRNKESDALIEEGRRTLDDTKRMAIWHRWQKLICDEQPYTFLDVPVDRGFINGRMRNTEPYKTGLAPYDWYVPAAMQKYH